MSFKIEVTESFLKDLKRLAKKYPSIKKDLEELKKTLEINPCEGVLIGENIYKIRLAIKSKGKGKSSGARVITFLYTTKETLYLLAIYDKSDIENISDSEIKERLTVL